MKHVIKVALSVVVIALFAVVFSSKNTAKARVSANESALTTHIYEGYKNRGIFGGVNNCKQKPGVCVIEAYN
jgi:hypothetical protein